MAEAPLQSCSDILGENTTKLLADKSHASRNQGAQDVERLTRQILMKDSESACREIFTLIDCIEREFLDVEVADDTNRRKGGIIGLACVVMSLVNNLRDRDKDAVLPQFLLRVVRSVVERLKDNNNRVRYYACEAMFNIAKACGPAVLTHFAEIFEPVCSLHADPDCESTRGAKTLDGQLRCIAEESPNKFPLAQFIEVLENRIQSKNHQLQMLLLSWIELLLNTSRDEMITYLPRYIDGLFKMLEGGPESQGQCVDIRQKANECLNSLLTGFAQSPPAAAYSIINASHEALIRCCAASKGLGDSVPTDSSGHCRRLTALCWLHEFVQKKIELTSENAADDENGEKWAQMVLKFLEGMLDCIDEADDDITRMAVAVNNVLLEFAWNWNGALPVQDMLGRLLDSMTTRGSVVMKTVCIQWIFMLLDRDPIAVLRPSGLNPIFNPILETVQDDNDEVVAAALGVLARLMEISDGSQWDPFEVVTVKLLNLFKSRREVLNEKGRLMIRHLCGRLDPRLFYVTVAKFVLQDTSDAEFAQQVVQTLNWILFTADETRPLRDELLLTASLSETTAAGAISKSLFLELLEPWFYSPVSALVLCIWAQQYEFAAELTIRLAKYEPTLDLLRQLDQLVHLLESPIFCRTRIRLLEPNKHPALFKCLLALAMILPQAGAFAVLSQRIQIVHSGLLLEWQAGQRQRSQHVPAKIKSSAIAALVDTFDQVCSPIKN